MRVEPEPVVLLPADRVAGIVTRLAASITTDYSSRNPLLVGVLKGSFVFMADLVRALRFPLEVDFIRLSSYGKGTETSGRIRAVQGLRTRAGGRHVLVIEDIVDTGLTTAFVLEHLAGEEAASVGLCALLDKPARRRVPARIDYLGASVPDRFIVGYGIDWNERFRNLPDICYIEEPNGRPHGGEATG